MKKCELLSPAGNMEMLKYAIMYGADAVYLAGTRFGARKFAMNFDREELKEAVKLAHLYGVKIYVTMNTLVYEEEIDEFIVYIKYIHTIGVDAVLVQDFGMINLVRKVAPYLEVHASTQFHNAGKKTLELLQSLGIKRAVLDREMSLDEINLLPDSIDKEVFCHGALCVSYSGQCLFSSMLLNRSGNRGECAGLCRLPYRLKEGHFVSSKREYYLSLKDLCSTKLIANILDAGVDSLKIEGRMKTPQYVGFITKVYRTLIDAYYSHEKMNISKEDLKSIKILFNRGITEGFLGNVDNSEIVNKSWSNHIGIPLGKYRVQKDKIKLELSDSLSQGDTIRFQEDGKGMVVNFLYDNTGNLINKAEPNKTVFVDNFLQVEKNGFLRKVGSKELTDTIDNLPKRSVSIDVHFKAIKNCSILLRVSDGKNEIEVTGSEPEKAKNYPINKSNVLKQLNKTGNTIYVLKNIDIDMDDDIFINIKDLNELRRTALDKLDEARIAQREIKFENVSKTEIENSISEENIIVVVETEEQYEVAKKYTENIFTSNTELVDKFDNLFLKYPNCNLEVATNKYMICDYGSLMNIKEGDEVFTDYMMNVTNSYTINSLCSYRVKNIMLSVELDYPRIEGLSQFADMSLVGVFVYGRIELMKMKYAPSEKKEASLIDRNGSEYPIKQSVSYNYLMSSKPLNRIDSIRKYANLGIRTYRLDFTDESGEECEKMLEKTHKIFSKE